MNDVVNQWLERPLYSFGPSRMWKIRDAVEGLLLIGATGVGKTSATGAAFAASMLSEEFGGLVLTAKPDDLYSTWARVYFAAAKGRSARDDIVVLQPEVDHPEAIWPLETLGLPHRYRYNILQHEYERSGGLTHSVVSLLLSGFATGNASVSKEDPYWGLALEAMLIHTVDLVAIATQCREGQVTLRLEDILAVIQTAPESPQAVTTKRFRSGLCYELLRVVDEHRNRLPMARYLDMRLTSMYWLLEFACLSEKTRSIIVNIFTSKVSQLLRSPLRELLCTTCSEEVDPRRSMQADPKTGRAKVIVLNLPTKLYGEVGAFAQVLFKTLWQREADRRVKHLLNSDRTSRPAFLWMEEAHEFVSASDHRFQATARSALVATVNLTQNLPNYYSTLSEAQTHSLLGHLQTKIFHANGEPTTNEWAERTFATDHAARPSLSVSFGPKQQGQGSTSMQHSREPVVPAIRFTTLAKATPNQPAAAYVFQPGQVGTDGGSSFFRHSFPLMRV